MKYTRYKVDLSKRLNGRNKGAGLIKAKSIAGKLLIVLLVYFAIAYPYDKYNNEYLPLIAGIDRQQTEISRASEELDNANKNIEDLSQRYHAIVAVQKQHISWTKKLFNITEFIPSNVFLKEIGLRQANDEQKRNVSSASATTAAQKSVYIRGLIPTLKKGEYLAKIVSMTKKINTDPEFTKDFYPMYLNYNKLVKLRQGGKEQKMMEFELEAETK